MNRIPEALHTDLVVRNRLGFFFGDTRVRLLEAISRHGSITQAARAVPLSYKAAWDAIDEMNNLAPAPVVVRSVGGRKGGGACLTAYGVKIIALYRSLKLQYDSAADTLAKVIDGVDDAQADELQALLARLSVRTSARNQFVGRIESLTVDPADVEVEVIIRVDEGFSLCAVLTADASERLDLRPGLQLAALVSAAAVYLATGNGLTPATRNRFSGRVLAVHRGPVNAEVTVELSGGRTLTATVTGGAVDELGLAPGVEAQAFFKASSLMLQRIGA